MLAMNRPYPPRRKQHGVALIETLVSILIFSFGVLGLLGLEASAITFSVDAEDRNRASLLANEIATYMWNQNSITIPAAQYTTWQTTVSQPSQSLGLPSGTLTITPTAGFTNSLGVANSADILITWIPKTDKNQTLRQLTTRVILP